MEKSAKARRRRRRETRTWQLFEQLDELSVLRFEFLRHRVHEFGRLELLGELFGRDAREEVAHLSGEVLSIEALNFGGRVVCSERLRATLSLGRMRARGSREEGAGRRLTSVSGRVTADPHEVHPHRVDAPQLHRLERVGDVPPTLAHLEPVHSPVPVRQDVLRRGQVEREEDRWEVQSVEALLSSTVSAFSRVLW